MFDKPDEELYLVDFSKFTLVPNKYLTQDFVEDPQFISLADFQFEISQIQMISSLEELEQAKEIINKSEVVGLDCEFKSNFIPTQKPEVSLIQIATREKCFIVDVAHLSKFPEMISFCQELFGNDSIKKIGFDFKNDVKTLIQTLNLESITIKTLFDLFEIHQDLHGEVSTLSNLVAKYFGKELDKFEQCSDWSTRPLRMGQLVYSAKDAICLVRAFDIMKKNELFIEEMMVDNDVIGSY